MKKIVTVILLSVCLFSKAQSETYLKEVKSALENNGTIAYYDNVVDELFGLLKENYKIKNVPDEVWEELQAVKPLALQNLIELVTQAYLPLYNEQDLKNMNAFYASEAGRNLFVKRDLSVEEKQALEQFYQTETGNKIVITQETLEASMRNTSQNWSGNLYLQLVDALTAKGYVK